MDKQKWREQTWEVLVLPSQSLDGILGLLILCLCPEHLGWQVSVFSVSVLDVVLQVLDLLLPFRDRLVEGSLLLLHIVSVGVCLNLQKDYYYSHCFILFLYYVEILIFCGQYRCWGLNTENTETKILSILLIRSDFKLVYMYMGYISCNFIVHFYLPYVMISGWFNLLVIVGSLICINKTLDKLKSNIWNISYHERKIYISHTCTIYV